MYERRRPIANDPLERAIAERSRRTDSTADNVLEEMATVGFSRITDYANEDEDGGIKGKSSREVQPDSSRPSGMDPATAP